MHPFPPPPPIWLTPSGGIVLYLVLLVVTFGAVGGFLLRRKRQPQTGDVAIWCAAGVVLTIVFMSLSANVYEYRKLDRLFLFVLWQAVVICSYWCWRRPPAKNETYHVIVGISAAALVEIVIVILWLPAVGRGHNPLREQCRDNLREIGLALHNYHDVADTFPPQIDGQPSVSWRVNLLPYLDHDDVHRDYDIANAWNSRDNLTIARHYIPEYTCPAVPRWYQYEDGLRFTSYAVAVGDHTLWQGDRPKSVEFATDGSTQTILVVEACGQQIVWTEPRDMEVGMTPIGINLPGNRSGESNGLISSYHSGGAHVTLADGAVRFMNDNIDPKVLEALLTTDGGEEVPAF